MPNPVTAPWILTGVVRLSATVGSLFGLAFILTSPPFELLGPLRYSGAAFQGMLDFPAAPGSWGAVLLIASLLTLAGSLSGRSAVTKLGLTGITCWCFFFSLTFLLTVFEDSRASITGVFAYAWLTLIHAAFAAAFGYARYSRRRRQ